MLSEKRFNEKRSKMIKKIMTKTDMKGIHGGGRLKQRIAEPLRASRAGLSMSTAGVSIGGTDNTREYHLRLGDVMELQSCTFPGH